jgi:Flp pilus assembly protein TadD
VVATRHPKTQPDVSGPRRGAEKLPATPRLAPYLGAIALIALIVRIVHGWQMRGTPFFAALMGDARGYDVWAQQIAAGEWIGKDVFYQAPLYPYFLGVVYSVFGHDLLVVRIIQAIVGSLSCALVGYAGSRLLGVRAGLLAGLALALYAPAIFFDALIQKSVLDVFFVAAMLALIARLSRMDEARESRRTRWVWAALGVAAGCLALTRENAIVLPLVLAVWAVVSGHGVPAGAKGRRSTAGPRVVFLALGLALVLLPVALRNYAVSGDFFLTTSQFGPNFYIGNHAGADGTYASLRFGRGSSEYERTDAQELAERAVGRTLTPADVSAYWTGRALDYIRTQPGAWLRLEARKLALLANATEMVDTESQESHAEWSMPLRVLGPVMHFGVLVPLAVFGLCVTWRQRRQLWVLYAIAAVYALSTIVFYVFARYRYPLVPLLVLFAAAGVVRAQEYMRTRPRAPVSGAVAAAAVAAAIANWPLLSIDLMRAITETNLGSALYENGQLADAEARYRRALEIQPDYAPAYNNLGVTLRAAGRTAEAIRTYETGLTHRDDYPDLHYNLANALLEENRASEASTHLREAARVLPASAGVHNNLGMALASEGRLAEAEKEFREAAALDPQSPKPLQNLGRILLEANRVDEAIAVLEEAVRRDPADADTHNNLGIALGMQGRLEAALTHFEEALRYNPGLEEARNNLQAVRAALAQRR